MRDRDPFAVKVAARRGNQRIHNSKVSAMPLPPAPSTLSSTSHAADGSSSAAEATRSVPRPVRRRRQQVRIELVAPDSPPAKISPNSVFSEVSGLGQPRPIVLSAVARDLGAGDPGVRKPALDALKGLLAQRHGLVKPKIERFSVEDSPELVHNLTNVLNANDLCDDAESREAILVALAKLTRETKDSVVLVRDPVVVNALVERLQNESEMSVRSALTGCLENLVYDSLNKTPLLKNSAFLPALVAQLNRQDGAESADVRARSSRMLEALAALEGNRRFFTENPDLLDGLIAHISAKGEPDAKVRNNIQNVMYSLSSHVGEKLSPERTQALVNAVLDASQTKDGESDYLAGSAFRLLAKLASGPRNCILMRENDRLVSAITDGLGNASRFDRVDAADLLKRLAFARENVKPLAENTELMKALQVCLELHGSEGTPTQISAARTIRFLMLNKDVSDLLLSSQPDFLDVLQEQLNNKDYSVRTDVFFALLNPIRRSVNIDKAIENGAIERVLHEVLSDGGKDLRENGAYMARSLTTNAAFRARIEANPDILTDILSLTAPEEKASIRIAGLGALGSLASDPQSAQRLSANPKVLNALVATLDLPDTPMTDPNAAYQGVHGKASMALANIASFPETHANLRRAPGLKGALERNMNHEEDLVRDKIMAVATELGLVSERFDPQNTHRGEVHDRASTNASLLKSRFSGRDLEQAFNGLCKDIKRLDITGAAIDPFRHANQGYRRQVAQKWLVPVEHALVEAKSISLADAVQASSAAEQIAKRARTAAKSAALEARNAEAERAADPENQALVEKAEKAAEKAARLKSEADAKAESASYAVQISHFAHVDQASGTSVQDFLGLFWLAVTDEASREKDVTQDDGLDAIANALYEIARAYNLSENEPPEDDGEAARSSCSGGAFNKISEKMISVIAGIDTTALTPQVVRDRLHFVIRQHVAELSATDPDVDQAIRENDNYLTQGVWERIKDAVLTKIREDLDTVPSSSADDLNARLETEADFPTALAYLHCGPRSER
ncbi:hypothetical protein [Martelella sp. HB161492]|uniref:hypothetical protein n=1 Tax=Martelella sp. HB161492 TaxID=2720726 RepID=UPI0015920DE4|nr:hypothetical protein [Martelella sp. HB161492]